MMPEPVRTKKAIKAAYENNKLHKRLCRQVGQAIGDFNMIEDGDKVMVCLSGGKDSHALLDVLLTLQTRAPIHFDIVAVNLEPVVPGYPSERLPDYLTERGVSFHIERQDTLAIVKRQFPEGRNACSLCARLRRGILYRVAGELGATKLALGHHREDILETFFLNLFFGGKLKTMPPKLRTDDGRHIVIRPLSYVKEADLARYAAVRDFPIIPCSLCGLEPNQQRRQMKEMLHEWEKKFPGRVENIFSSLSTVVPSHLMDAELFGFRDLKAEVSMQTDSDDDSRSGQ
jgi:tRNA 2-thiocytidine biosynthesis protein TtcA